MFGNHRKARRPQRSTGKAQRRLKAEALEPRRMLTAWTNTDLPADVDASSVVAPLDALLVINELNDRVFSDSVNGILPEDRPAGAPFLDVTDSGSVAPLDALFVINELPSSNANSFTVAENAEDDTLVGRVEVPGGITADTIFEIRNSSNLTDEERDVLALKPDDHFKGAADAPVILIEYLDLACPVCGVYHPFIQEALDTFDGEIAVVTRHLPLTSIHPSARAAAVAAEAAGRQGKFDEMVDILFERRVATDWDQAANPVGFFRQFAGEIGLNVNQFQSDFEDSALFDRVNRDGNEAFNVLGVSSTPTFILNNQPAGSPSLSQEGVNDFFQNAVDALESPFKLDRYTGEIRVRDGSLLDFDRQSSYQLDVFVDGVVQQVTINVTDASL